MNLDGLIRSIRVYYIRFWILGSPFDSGRINKDLLSRSEGVRSALRALEARLRQFESGLCDHKTNNKVMKEIDKW